MSQRFFAAESRSTFKTSFAAAVLLLLLHSNNVVNGLLSTSFVRQNHFSNRLRCSVLLAEKNDNNVEEDSKDVLLSQLYQEVKKEGQVGSSLHVREIAQRLVPYSIAKPAQVSLTGVHKLLYSQSKGASSGAIIGPLVGKVTQTFLDESNFINAVSLGPITIQLHASRKVVNDTSINVYFHETVVQVFGVEVSRRKSKGQGVWTNLFVGEHELEGKGKRKLVRIIETPSLFIIEQSLSP